MSTVTNVIVTCSLGEEEACRRLQVWLYDNDCATLMDAGAVLEVLPMH